MNIFSLKLVHHMPVELEENILYVSEEFEIAGHLCPCGCGNKIMTPLGVNEWSFTIFHEKPTLKPSIGNWQLPCRSHYWINQGKILWSNQWSEEEIEAGRMEEQERRVEYYDNLEQREESPNSIWNRIKKWFSNIWKD